jgi:TolB-like protein
VAVLPINVFDSSDDAQYFADGLVEETLRPSPR